MHPSFLIGALVVCLIGTCVSAILALLSHGKTGHALSMATLAASTAVGAVTGGLALVQGGIPAAKLLGISFSFDGLSAFFFVVVNAVSCIVSLFAIAYVNRHAAEYRVRVLDALTAVFVFGMQGVLLAATPFSFLAFWELMSIGSFFLVMADKKPESVRAALLYLIMTHLGAGAILAGFMLLSHGTALAGFAQIAVLADGLPPATLMLACALLFFGFGSKAGLWPFHVWLPEAHPQAPSHISALMSGVMLNIAFYGFLRVVLSILPPIPAVWALPVIALGLISALYGALHAIIERDLKRMLAYSSIENLGLMFAMVGIGLFARAEGSSFLSAIAIIASLVHALAHAVFKSGLFMGAGAVIGQTHSRDLETMGGLARRMPKFSIAMLLLALGGAALPPFAAFMGEWLFLQGLVASIPSMPPFGQALLIAVLSIVALVGGLAAFAMVKMFGIAFLAKPRSAAAERAEEPSFGHAWPVFVMAALTVLLGVCAPAVFNAIGFSAVTDGLAIGAGMGRIVPAAIALAFTLVVACVFLLRRALSNSKNERQYHAWDCGQPTTAAMEYTATAFSAPIRFFFRPVLRTRKTAMPTPLVETNPWIVRREWTLEIRQVWFDVLYRPVSRAILSVSRRVRRLQNGIIQFYIALILAALILTLAFTL